MLFRSEVGVQYRRNNRLGVLFFGNERVVFVTFAPFRTSDVAFVLEYFDAVSYTHLDVYKRQVVIAALVILVDQILKAYVYEVSKQLAVYVCLLYTSRHLILPGSRIRFPGIFLKESRNEVVFSNIIYYFYNEVKSA